MLTSRGSTTKASNWKEALLSRGQMKGLFWINLSWPAFSMFGGMDVRTVGMVVIIVVELSVIIVVELSVVLVVELSGAGSMLTRTSNMGSCPTFVIPHQ